MSLNFDREVRRVGRRKGECDLIKSVQGRVKARCVWAISERHGQRQPRPVCTWAPTQFQGFQGNCMLFLKAVNVGNFASMCVNLYEFLVHVSNSVYAEPTDKVLKWKHEGRVAGRGGGGGKKTGLNTSAPWWRFAATPASCCSCVTAAEGLAALHRLLEGQTGAGAFCLLHHLFFLKAAALIIACI